jgi:linearmycin/streptolysin S transport system permease protein
MILPILRTGWMNLRRDRAALLLSFVVPIVFFSIFAGVFGSRGNDATSKVKVMVIDDDASESSRRLVEGLKAEPSLRVIDRVESKGKPARPFDRASAEELVRSGEGVAVVIPKGFGTSQIQFGPGATNQPKLEIIADRSDPVAPQVVGGLLQKVAMTSMPGLMMKAGVDAMDQYSGGLTPEQKQTLDQNIASFEQTQTAATTSTSTSTGALIQVKTSDVQGDKKRPLIAFYAAGIGVMFLLFTASGAGGALLDEHDSGTLDRILTTRVSMSELLIGKLLFLTTLGVTQLIVMFLWAALVFGLDFHRHLPGFFVMAIATALACSSFGLLLASLARSRAQLSAITTLLVLSISAVGGSMFPRFLMPEAMQKAGLVVFNSWALEGFLKVFWREEPLLNLWPQVAVLLGTTALFFLLARRIARRWEIA